MDLPFCPRELVASRDGSKLVVADAFGGKLALVDWQRRSLEAVRSIPAHNIRGLALTADGRTLVVAHQMLNPLARSTFDDLHWGLLISNHLRVLRLDAVLKPDADLLKGSRLFELGDVGKGAADPSGLVVDSGGHLVVALGGVNEMAITQGPGQPLRRVAVGSRPGGDGSQPGWKVRLHSQFSRRHDLGRRDRQRPTSQRPSRLALVLK